MDFEDKSLLFELVEDCRTPFSKLSERLNISIDEVDARLHQLVRDRIILKFTIAPVPALFGAKEAILFFRSSQPIGQDRINSLGMHPAVEFISVGTLLEGFSYIHFRTQNELDSVVKYFRQVNPAFEEVVAYPVQLLSEEARKIPKRNIYAFKNIDWLMLIYLREQGRLSLAELSTRTNIAMETLQERLEFLRTNNLIEETIHINPAKTQKENWTIFRLKLTILTKVLFEELKVELESIRSYWSSSCWKVSDKSILILGFLCSSFSEVEKIEAWLSETPGLISIEKTIGGTTYYFPDFRDELLEEKRKSSWFSVERWVDPDKRGM